MHEVLGAAPIWAIFRALRVNLPALSHRRCQPRCRDGRRLEPQSVVAEHVRPCSKNISAGGANLRNVGILGSKKGILGLVNGSLGLKCHCSTRRWCMRGRVTAASSPIIALIHRSAWRDCPKRALSNAPGMNLAGMQRTEGAQKGLLDGL
jgi:hypothetical protein